MILLDTHVLVWYADGDERLGIEARQRVDAAVQAQAAQVSAISFWEVAMLAAKGRLELRLSLEKWSRSVLNIRGIRFVPLEPRMAIEAGCLPGSIHGDPGDRLVIATARVLGCPVLTLDRRILAYAREGHVEAVRGDR